VLFSWKDSAWKVADFGFCSEGTSSIQLSSYARGTPGYRAPELLKEPSTYTNRVDIFAVGCTFYELTTGKRPFHNDHFVHEYSFDSDLPENPMDTLSEMMDRCSISYLSTVILKMINANPQKRPSAKVLLGALESIIEAVQLPITEIKVSPFLACVANISENGNSFQLLPLQDVELITDPHDFNGTDLKLRKEMSSGCHALNHNDETWTNLEWERH
jgi:serine/threonine protein kinase